MASNSLSTTQIMITNPTPLVENEEDEREEDTQKSYYVEDSSFSMSMSDEKKDKYQNSVPVEVNEVVDLNAQSSKSLGMFWNIVCA